MSREAEKEKQRIERKKLDARLRGLAPSVVNGVATFPLTGDKYRANHSGYRFLSRGMRDGAKKKVVTE